MTCYEEASHPVLSHRPSKRAPDCKDASPLVCTARLRETVLHPYFLELGDVIKRSRQLSYLGALQALGILVVLLGSLRAHAQAQCASPANAIVAENCLPGSPSSEWDVGEGSTGDLTIQGFADNISVNQGGTINFKISTPAKAYTIAIYRIGYYGGDGARKVATITPSAQLPQSQPACLTNSATGLIDCGNWAVSASWQVPTTATSGVYFAHLIRSDTGGDSHIVFIVRNDASHSAILYQTADESWQAYNYYGAGSLYSTATPVFDLTDRSYKVSYNRPFLTRGFNQEWDTWIFGAEFAMIQWMESNGYDVTYFTGVDADRSGSLILNHKVYMDAGHDEYWTGAQRANVQAARDAGVNLAFFSGNTMFWKTRWENSVDGTNTANRTLVCYKETLAFAKIDPQDPPIWTGTFRDPSFSPPADGGNPENSLVGTLFMVNGTGPDNDGSQQIQVPYDDGQMRFWRNTAVASLSPGASYTLPKGSLGYEWDVDADNAVRPAGAFHLSTTTETLTTDYLLDYGATYGAGTATHHLMEYRAPSGALVFSTGSIDWSWGLNTNHDNLWSFTNQTDINMQQATVNLFADMGVQPATLQPGLVAASASTDTIAPTSVITSPATGVSLPTGTPVTVTGTATDSGGGVVAGVEVSTDNGTTWHPATGRSTWSYTWIPTVVSTSEQLLSRAVDDSGNIEIPSHNVTVTVNDQTCPCTIWNPSATPATPDSGDGNAIEIGVQFRADANGSVIGARFYKAATNTGTHVAHLWTSSGTLLGTATFTSESSAGWQQVNFPSPIAVVANTVYVISYFAPKGHYAADSYYFATAGVDDPPLHALQNGVNGGDGLFVYPSSGVIGGFPTSTNLSANYWVDVVYSSSNTYNLSGTLAGPGGAGATVTLTGTETLTTTADSSGNYSFAGLVNGTYTITPTNPGVTFTPGSQTATVAGAVLTGINFSAVVTNPLTISGTVTGAAGATVNLAGSASASTIVSASGTYSFTGLLNGSYTVTPILPQYIFNPGTQSVVLSGSSVANVNFAGQLCNCVSLWPSSATPAVIDPNDGTPIEVGVRFQSSIPGSIIGLRFYKAATNTGTHIGHIWSATGALLGTATFANESASGWQQVTFASPITLAANTQYIASYYAPAGHYSADVNYFATNPLNSAPLQAPANTTADPNGLYVYTSSSGGGFPTNSYSSTNYWVDVVFTGAQAYTLTGTITGAPGASVALSGSATATTTADNSGNFSFNVYPGSYFVTPSLPQFAFLPGTQAVNITSGSVSGVNFSVPSLCPCDSIWSPATVPGTVDSGDGLPYEVGVKLRADTDGYILGVRFYKASTNTGTHLGHLWANNGSTIPLAAATFTGESSSGWQQVTFTNPLPVSANTTYIASYFTPVGHYAVDNAFFTSAGVDTPPLHALATGVDGANGVYLQSATSALPTSSFNNSNYWVDVIYATAVTFSLGGNISGAGGPGAVLTLTGTTTATATADANGNFTVSSLPNGTYTVTPSQPGYIFTPSSQTVSINGAHQLAVNFVSAPPSFAVSGTISGGPLLTVALSSTTAPTVTTTTDANGNFTFPAVLNGSYTVTPTTAGIVYNPTSQSITVNGANLTAVNFTASSLSYPLSGTITGGAGATVYLTGSATASTVADQYGNFSFPALTNGSYSLTPALAGLVFTPTSLNATVTGAAITGANFTVPAACPCTTVWQPTAVPLTIDDGDNSSIEVGVKLRADSPGLLTGIRFYKAAANTGTHLGHLWSSTGNLLATATFTGESSSGWQQAFFTTPVQIAANTTYVASYFAPAGRYSGDSNFFAGTGVDSPPLHALANGVDGPDGVYAYGTASTFPSSTAAAANYWVDAIFVNGYTVSGTLTGAAGAGATVTLNGPITLTTTADNSGAYSFLTVPNGTYSVTPSSSTATFAPAQQTITVNSANATVSAFASTANTYTISGSISGAGGNGATLTLSGAASATITASSTGAYTFTGLANGSYTVIPSKTGFTFTPASQAVTISNANGTANFTAAPLTYTISGTISGAGGNGATVALSGAASATTTASSTGAFTFTGLANGSYTVTPSKTGFTFTPASQAVAINSANGTANFTTVTYTISGNISGAGGNGATVALSGAASATTTASSTGAYTFTGLTNGAYTVTPSKTGFTFTPASQAVTLSSANGAANFATVTYTITGTISGAGGNGATVTLSGAASSTTTASSTGAYTFTGLTNGAYTVTPSKTGFTFTPASQAVIISNANGTANFTATPLTYTISGTISGTGGNGATVTLSGAASATTTASSTGAYTFTGLANGSYTVKPSKNGFTFTPASQAVTINNGNGTANFTTVTYTITGTISGAGGNGATVALSGAASATTTASSTGAFTFTGLANGSYTVTPSKTGFTFSPTSKAVTISNGNATASFSTVTYIITGTVSGKGGNAATVTLSGAASATTTASSAGAYTFSGLTNGSYTVTPSKTGFTFTPARQAVTISSANVTANFATVSYTITGTVSGKGGNGAIITLSGAASAITTASSTGAYTFSGLTNGSYIVIPFKLGFTFSPLSRAVTISNGNGTANFSSAVTTATLPGSLSNPGANGATVLLNRAAGLVDACIPSLPLQPDAASCPQRTHFLSWEPT